MELFDKTKFKSNEEMIAFMVANKDSLMAQKKAQLKHADCISFAPSLVFDKGISNKANNPVNVSELNELKVLIVINTTNLLDNHKDVHIPGLWKKSLKENKSMMHLQEHAMKFQNIIADGSNLKAYTKGYNWAELGFDFKGETEALVFESTIERKRNEFMFDQYANGYVKNHSVGMRYVQLVFCVNDENYGAEFEAWEKYYPQIANKEDADNTFYFWAVKEAKAIEGSAVPLGSNWATPTLDNNLKSSIEPPIGTQQQPEKSTGINYDFLIKGI